MLYFLMTLKYATGTEFTSPISVFPQSGAEGGFLQPVCVNSCTWNQLRVQEARVSRLFTAYKSHVPSLDPLLVHLVSPRHRVGPVSSEPP